MNGVSGYDGPWQGVNENANPHGKDYGRTQGPSKRDSLARDSGASAADVFPLSSEAFHLLRSLPKWNGPNVSGAFATQATDELCRMGLAVGSLAAADRPFDEDEDDPRVWRTMAGDVLLATVGAMQTPEAIALSRPDAVSGHKNTPIPAKQGEGLSAKWQAKYEEAKQHAADNKSDYSQGYASALFWVLADLHDANLTEQDEAPPLDEWQPIETAPDGKRVMLATEHIAHPGTVYWALGDAKFVWLPPQVHGKPTHWKPIGNLPNGTQND